MSVVFRNLPATGIGQESLKIRLAPRLIDRLNGRAQRNSTAATSEITGLLYGSAKNGVVTVEGLKPFSHGPEKSNSPAASRESLARAFDNLIAASRTDPDVSSLEVVGWYCVRAQGGLLGGDVEFHNLNFYRPTDIALVARNDSGTDLLFEVYSKSADALLSPQDHRRGVLRIESGNPIVGVVEVTISAKINDLYLPAYRIEDNTNIFRTLPYWQGVLASASQVVASLKQKVRAPELIAAPSPLPATPILNSIQPGVSPGADSRTQRKPKQSLTWQSSIFIFALAAAFTFALIYGIGSQARLQEFLGIGPVNTGLGLRLDTQGERLLLSWNRSNPAVSSARSGLLRIDDGSLHRDIQLNAAQVANGSVLYRPNSDDVAFALEVIGKTGNKLNESIRVLDSHNPAKSAESLPPQSQPQTPVVTPRVVAVSKPTLTPAVPARPKRIELAKNVVAQNALNRPVPPKAQPSSMAVEPSLPKKEPLSVSSPTESAPQLTQAKQLITPTPTQVAPLQQSATPTTQKAVSTSPVEAPSPRPEPVVQPPAPLTPAADAVYLPPQPLKQVLPNSQLIPATTLLNHPRLEVTVQVDAKGRVTAAHLNGQASVNSALSGAAVSAAKEWKFKPATLRGQPIASQHTIVFQFQPRR